MRRLAVATALTLAASAAACSPDSAPELISAPEVPTTAATITSTSLAPAPTTTEASTTTTTEPVPEASTTTAPQPRPTATTLRVQTTTAQRSTSAILASIRACESGNDYTADTGNGYYGAYQFHPGTWRSVGGTGNPAHASPAEQDMRAQMMLDAGRRGEWPNC